MIVVTLSYCFCLFSFCGVTVFCLWQYFLFHYSSYYDITAVQWDPQKRSFDNPMNYIGHAHQTLTRRNWTGSALSTWRSEIDAMHQYQRENSNVISYLFHTTDYLFTCARGIFIKIYEIYFHMKLYSFGTYMLTCQNMSIQWLTDQLTDGIGAISSEKWHNRKKTSKKDMRGKPGDGRSFRSEIVLRSILLLGLQHHPVGQVRCLQLPALLRVGHGGRGHHLEGGN